MNKILYPLALALALIVGIYVGGHMPRKSWKSKANQVENNTKLEKLFGIIGSEYVDSVNVDSLVENAIPTVLSELDPHSSYLSNHDRQMANDDLEGSFSGIGVQFSIEDDTVMISNVISGGPCERKGVKAGDRIVKVDDKDFTGKAISNTVVVKTLRGKKGSHVKIGIKRAGNKDLIDFDIVRDDISVSSIDAAYIIEKGIGYVRVNKFGEHTYSEFLQSLNSLKEQGAERFIVDLRENPGGFLGAACLMINEFLEKGQMIVYTKDRYGKCEKHIADGRGHFKDAPVTVLINEWSASASEIFSGAIQDNDRGKVVGRRSFGKGLVQTSFQLDDSSEVRLTIARYYTPSGRCIQKPYKADANNDYSSEIVSRYESGELEDSSKYKHSEGEEQFQTVGGRTVYGGGGITPDVFVPIKKDGANSYFKMLNDRVLYDFCFFYTDKNRNILSQFKTKEELVRYLDQQNLEWQLADFAKTKNKIKVNPTMLQEARTLIRNRVNACIVRNFFGDLGFFSVLNEIDPIVKKAIEINLEK